MASLASDDFRFCPKFSNSISHIRQLKNADQETDRYIDHILSFKIFQLFKELKIGTVITDTSGRRDCLHMQLTTPMAFIRFVGNNMHPTDFLRIDSWVDRIKNWIDKGFKEIYFFIDNHEEPNSPELCKLQLNNSM